MPNKVAALLTCHNRVESTIQCLDRLFTQVGISDNFQLEVFLVDDGCSDGTCDRVIERFPNVNVITGTGNLYWNRGMHLAWQTALESNSFDYYLWLNDDTGLRPDAVVQMIRIHQKSPTIGIVCGAIQSKLTGEFTYGGRDNNGRELVPAGKPQECFTINGNCVLVGKDVVEKIGILDPQFPHGMGDYDFGLRARAAGFSVVTTGEYVAECESNARDNAWYSQKLTLFNRFKKLYSPLGCHPFFFFVFEKRHYGYARAVVHFVSLHLRALFPAFWKLSNTKR